MGLYNYPYGDTQQINLDWFFAQWETFKAEWATAETGISGALDDEIARVEAAMTDLYAARDAAIAAKNDAVTAKTAAQTSATAANNSANAANTSASAASGYATNASNSASAAASDAASALSSKNAAAASATSASNSATAAGTSETNAGTSATIAGNSATAASNSATAADASALKAEGFAVGEQSGTPVASGSPYYENNAEYYAGEAATSAAAAATSAASADGAAAQAMIAGAETSTTSAHAYAIGDYFRLNGVLYQATAPIAIGDTISSGTNCAVAVLGNDVSELKNALSVEPINWLSDSYIPTNGTIGSVVNLTPNPSTTGYRCAVVDCAENDNFYIDGILGGTSPRAFAFIDSEDKLLSYRSVGSMNVLEPFILTAPANAAKVIFNDHHSPLNGIIYKGVPPAYTYFYANSIIASDLSNTNSAIMGGGSRIGFRQGGGSTDSDGYMTYTYRTDRCSTDYSKPFSLCSGDVITCAAGMRYVLYRISVSESGSIPTQIGGWKTGSYTVTDDGLYYIICEKVPATQMTPTEAAEAFWIQHKGFRPDNLFVLERNPYNNVVWDAVQDVTSVSHAHCTTQEDFETLQAHYDHVAISNYVPAIPYYPLDQHFTDIGTTLASPNAEHRHFTGSSASVHMNSLGSFLTSNGDYVGTANEMINATSNTLKLQCGGGVTINHPKWSSLTKAQIESFINRGGVLGVEIWNASAEQSNSTGDSTELWDSVLADGVQCYGFAVPDHEAQYRPDENRQPFGYNHMLVVNKTEDEILSAYRMGHFYTTLYNDGLTLEELSISSGTVSVEVSEESIFTFITASRTVTSESASTTATFATQSDDIYVRVEATHGTNKLYSNAIFL